jgi:hypothetical protein
MPPRITRKSTRPRASDRPMVDTVQPHGLLSFRNRSASSLLNEDAAAEMEQRKTNPGARHQTSVFHSHRGLDVAEILPPSGRGRSISLTSPFIDQAISLVVFQEVIARKAVAPICSVSIAPTCIRNESMAAASTGNNRATDSGPPRPPGVAPELDLLTACPTESLQ